MNEQLVVQITGKDGISKVFETIARGADRVGDSVEQAGKQGAKGMDQLRKSAEQNAQRISRIRQEATAVGSVIGTMAGGVAIAGQAFRDQERQVTGITRLYGEAADEMLAFAEAMQDNLGFSNDAARESMLIASSLSSNYELTADQIAMLIERSADLATVYGTTLPDAVQRLSGAIRGEGEAAEALGLNMSDAAVQARALEARIVGWNVPGALTEAEKAAFRFQLLMEDTTSTVGVAEARADSAGGMFREFINEIGDGVQIVGQFLGPVGEVAAELAPIAMAAPVAGAAIGRMSTAMKGSSIAAAALGVATNPVAIGLGALTVAGIATWSMFREGQEASQGLEDALIQLGDVAENLRLAGRNEEASFVDEFRADAEEITRITEEIGNDQARLMEIANRVAGQRGVRPEQVFDEIADGYRMTTEEAQRYADVQVDIGAAFANSNVDAEALDAHLDSLREQFDNGTITFDQYLAALEEAANGLSQFGVNADTAANSATGLAAALRLVRPEMEGLVKDFLAFNEIGEDDAFGERFIKTLGLDMATLSEVEVRLGRLRGAWSDIEEDMPDPDADQEEWMAWVNQAERGTIEWQRRVQAANEARAAETDAAVLTTAALEAQNIVLGTTNVGLEEMARNWNDVGAAASAALEVIDAQAREEFDAAVQRNRDFIASMLEITGQGDFLSQWNMTGMASEASLLAGSIDDVSTSLDGLQRIIIGNTDAIGSQMQGLEDWALELINVKGEVGEIDKLLAEGRITWDQYTDAQAAQVEISEANATVQRDLLAIQAMQAPVLVDNADALADYVEQLRLMNDGTEEGAQQQLAALAMMDGAVMGQVEQFTEMIGMMGRIGPEGAESMQMFIDSIVATNPALTAVLIEMGLIEEAANGQYVLNLDAAGAISEIDALNHTVADLIDLLDDGKLNDSYTANIDLEVKGRDDIEGAKRDINDLMALSAQERMIEIGTKVLPPEPGSAGWEEWNTAIEPVTVPSRLDVPANIRDVGLDVPPISVPVELDFGSVGGGAAGLAQSAAEQAMGGIATDIEVTVAAVADTSAADQAIADLSAYDGTTIATPMVMVDGDASDAIGTVTSMQGFDAMTLATAIVGVDGDASHAVGTVQAMAGYDGLTLATAYVNIEARDLTGGRLSASMAGGVVSEYMAGGLIPARLGEAGGEVLHLEGGGYAYAPHDGLYMTPIGSYVSPAPSSPNMVSGGVHVHFNGNFYGSNRDELNAWAEETLIPSFTTMLERHERALGGI